MNWSSKETRTFSNEKIFPVDLQNVVEYELEKLQKAGHLEKLEELGLNVSPAVVAKKRRFDKNIIGTKKLKKDLWDKGCKCLI